MDFRGRTVAITGGTGALGTAVVEGFLAAGAICHVPYLFEAEGRSFPLRDRAGVTLYPRIDLTEEAAVGRFYEQVPNLWASVHLAGGFAVGAVTSAGKAVLAGQLDINVVTCYLSCRAAILAMAANPEGGRIVEFSASGSFVSQFGSKGTAGGQLLYAVRVDPIHAAGEVIDVDGIGPPFIERKSVDVCLNPLAERL